MRYWLDTEFIENGKTIDLLSIGIVAEDDRKLYLQTERAAFYCKHPEQCPNEWVRENVVPHLNDSSWLRSQIQSAILEFCDPSLYGKPEFWGYYCAYDHVVFCQIFGTMMDLPDRFPMYCNDIQQWRRMLGSPGLPKQQGIVHHALHDARYCKELWNFLDQYSRSSRERRYISGKENPRVEFDYLDTSLNPP